MSDLDDDREDPREVGYPPVLCDYCHGGRHEGIACDEMVATANAILAMRRSGTQDQKAADRAIVRRMHEYATRQGSVFDLAACFTAAMKLLGQRVSLTLRSEE